MIANLDRWVRVLEPIGVKGRHCRLSELETEQCIVLLGEPGIGKTTVLAQSAEQAGTSVVTVRKLLLSSPPAPGESILFIDALDQARTRDGSPDKVDALAIAIRDSTATQWRLTCRSEDWRGRADLEALVDDRKNDVLVVQLLPLQYEEKIAILRTLGSTSPDAFLDRAQANGAMGFTETPLMLQLLYGVVQAEGRWPPTRHDLYSKAIVRLVAETNDERESRPRARVPVLVDAAGIVSLLLLTTGAEGIWRSSALPPLLDQTAYVLRDDCDLPIEELDNLLDSALFRGESRVFEPAHRTFAEFLAGRALAHAVVGGPERASYPLSRALALITGVDRKAPTELRGVYAWLCVHLAQLGQIDIATSLAQADPVSCLHYGDVASFPADVRRALLYSLPSEDPYFRSQATGDTSIGGLASEDLAQDFRLILNDKDRQNHLEITVLDALAGGAPVPSLGDLMAEIAHDETRPEEHRIRAINAILNASEDRDVASRRLFDSLSTLSPSNDREGLRALVLGEIEGPIDANCMADILVTYGLLATDNTVSRLYPLQQILEGNPRPDLLEALDQRRPLPWADDYDRPHIEELLGDVFVTALADAPTLDPDSILRWVAVLTPKDYGTQRPRITASIRQWMEAGSGRDVELFDAMRATHDPEHGWVAHTFNNTCGCQVSGTIIEHLFRRQQPDETEDDRALRISDAVTILVYFWNEGLIDSYWQAYESLVDDTHNQEHFEKLTVCEIPNWRLKNLGRKQAEERRHRITRRWRNRRLQRDLSGIRDGYCSSVVSHGAEIFFHPESSGILTIVQVYGQEIADAIVHRCIWLACNGLDRVGLHEIAAKIQNGRSDPRELPAMAGTQIMRERGEFTAPEDVPLSVIFSILAQHSMISDESNRQELGRYALEALCQSDTSMNALDTFWLAALDAGAISLPGITVLQKYPDLTEALSSRLEALLYARPNLPSQVLREIIRLVVGRHGANAMIQPVEAALSSTLSNQARGLWLAAGVEIDPARFSAHLPGISDIEILTQALADYAMCRYGMPLIADDSANRAARAELVIIYLGPSVSPAANYECDSGTITSDMRRCDAVRRAMSVLAADSSMEVNLRTCDLLGMATIEQWHPDLQHALAEQAALRRDEAFKRPQASVVRAALSGGAPLNASDLRAIVVDELRSQANTLRTEASTPWLQFWNTDKYGRAETPRIENICRDLILTKLEGRLDRYAISGILPEAQRGCGTRADMLALCGAGASLPVEVKRHNHAALWETASSQLQGYANAPGADGLGVLLVLWFGSALGNTPVRQDKHAAPTSAMELESMLRNDLPEELKNTTDIIVFDVSMTDSN